MIRNFFDPYFSGLNSLSLKKLKNNSRLNNVFCVSHASLADVISKVENEMCSRMFKGHQET